ncbi:MAG TPA: hypothetical protein VGD43_19105 [Micromonospora sp.]
MWKRRIAVLATLTMATVVGPAPPAAWAGGPGEMVTGDFDADGFQDESFLGVVQPDMCSVVIRFGAPPGGPRHRPWRTPS